jgi:hypothetical protein
VVVALGLGRVVPSRASGAGRLPDNRPIEIENDGYVGSSTCRSCHPMHYATWHRSYHRTMTQVATPASVLGNFDTTIDYEGASYVLERDGDEFWVEMKFPVEGQPGKTIDVRKPVVLTTGSHHMQVYWYATERQRELVALPFAFLKDDRRWVPRVSIFLAPPDVRWGMELGAWNATCIKCHATHGRPRIRGIGEVDSDVAEFGIACEACHGPADEHVRANRDPRRRYGLHLGDEADDTVIQPRRLDARPSSHVCGQCHGVTLFRDGAQDADFREHGFRYRPGDDLEATRLIVRPGAAPDDPELQRLRTVHPTFRDEDQFWSDGMVRVSGREFSGMSASPCYEGGKFACVSCHTMHKPTDDPRSIDEWADAQLPLGMDGDEACLQCHEKFRAAPEKHSFHEADSSGNRCTNCHMPYTTYGLLKAIRSHEVSSPSVQESLETGRPNACNQCHLDKTLGWTAEHLALQYETPSPELTEKQRTIAASVLWTLEGDAGQRALMAWSFGWEAARETSGSTWMVPYVAQLMLDPYHAVRYIAGRSLGRIEGFEDFEYDHMAERMPLARINRSILAEWRKIADRSVGRALLIDSDGGVDVVRYMELLHSRDNHPMILKE